MTKEPNEAPEVPEEFEYEEPWVTMETDHALDDSLSDWSDLEGTDVDEGS